MTARKSLPGRLSRFSRLSVHSQISEVLDSNSDVDSDIEGQPLWFKDFENNSVNIRPSARFSSPQNETPLLDPNSDPESTPLQKTWWKNLDNTPVVPLGKSNITGDQSNVPERSNMESSDTSSFDEDAAKQRLRLRRNARKSLQRNVFSEILDRTKDSITSAQTGLNAKNQERRDATVLTSDTDISIEKIRKLPFKKRKTRTIIRSSNIGSKSGEITPEVFKKVLDTSQSIYDTHGENEDSSKSGSSTEYEEALVPGPQSSAKRIRLDLEHPPSNRRRNISDESESTTVQDDEWKRSRSPAVISRSKKRSIFTKTTNRRSPNFDELLDDESKDEYVHEQLSIRKEMEVIGSERGKESVAQPSPELGSSRNQEDESESEESVKKQRVLFARKTRKNQQEKRFSEFLESPNTSVRLQPIRYKTGKLELTRNEIPYSDIERRSSKNRTIPANVEEERNESARRLSRSSSNANKLNTERRSISKKNDYVETPQLSDIESEENFASGGNKSGIGRRSTTKNNDRPRSFVSSFDELDKNQSVGIPIRSPSIGSKFDAEGESMTRKSNPTETSKSQDIGVEETKSLPIPNRGSISLRKSRASNQNKTRSDQLEVNEDRSHIQEKNITPRIYKKSASKEPQVSTAEQEDEKENSTDIEDRLTSSRIINQAEKNQEYSNHTRSQPRDTRADNNMETTIPFGIADEITDRRKTASTSKHQSTVARNLEKTIQASQENNLDVEKENNRSCAKNNRENAIIETQFTHTHTHTGLGTLAQSVGNRTKLSVRHVDYDELGSSQQVSALSKEGSDAQFAEKLSQVKSEMEKLKQEEMMRMKDTRIDSYFKKKSATNRNNIATDSQRVPKRPRPVEAKNKTAKTAPNKAYIVNGKVYKPPKLPRPKPWATDRLYKFLWKKMEPKYGLKTRVRSEKFIIDMSKIVAIVVRRGKYNNYKEEMNTLIREMAHLQIIKTRNDFNLFCQEFLPYEFRIKVIPMILPGNVRNIPFEPDKLHTPILDV